MLTQTSTIYNMSGRVVSDISDTTRTRTQPIGMSDIYLTREILFINNMAERQCVSCKTATKYNCINCSVFVCNRVGCSLAELDESTAGWIAQQSVGYCKSCADEVISDYQEQ